MSDAPHCQAAFINAIREEGTHKEACDYLQKTWNELQQAQAEIKRLSALPAIQPDAQCCMCGKKGLSTEEDGGPECELHDGRWVCSENRWNDALEPSAAAIWEAALNDALVKLAGVELFGRTTQEQHVAMEQYARGRDAILALINNSGKEVMPSEQDNTNARPDTAPAGLSAGGGAEPTDTRPTSCRFRLRDEGKLYPRGRCDGCKPIIFSAAMVRAILDGRKAQTRRILKLDPAPVEYDGMWMWGNGIRWGAVTNPTYPPLPYAPGDRLWVKEAWRTDLGSDHLRPSELDRASAAVWFDASSDWNDKQRPRYRSARFMPRWASRLTLTVTDVRVQRLQDISEADAVAEGVNPCLEGNQCPDGPHGGCCAMYDPKGTYAALWNDLHGPAAWDRNPWVAAYTFTVQRGNIDGGKS